VWWAQQIHRGEHKNYMSGKKKIVALNVLNEFCMEAWNLSPNPARSEKPGPIYNSEYLCHNRFKNETFYATALQNKLQAWVFDIVTHQMFEITIMVLIILNMLTMMVESHNMSKSFTEILEYINYVFVAIFTGEAIIKVGKIR